MVKRVLFVLFMIPYTFFMLFFNVLSCAIGLPIIGVLWVISGISYEDKFMKFSNIFFDIPFKIFKY